MSKDKKDKIEAIKEKFLNEINQHEDELMDEVAGGAMQEEALNISCPVTNHSCGKELL